MWLLCGVNIPLESLPGWMAQIGRLLPLTHGIAAGREVAGGASLSAVSGLVWTELAVGIAWGTIAFTFVRLFEYEGAPAGDARDLLSRTEGADRSDARGDHDHPCDPCSPDALPEENGRPDRGDRRELGGEYRGDRDPVSRADRV
jgi:hypothetical protein